MTESISAGHGTGRFGDPLAFGSWVLVRNPRFRAWNPAAQPQGYPDRIVLREGQGAGLAVSDLARGGLDVLVPAPKNRLSELATHYTEQFHTEPSGATTSLAMNTRVAPFNNVIVRRALNYAINRWRLVELAGGPLAAQPTCQILPPTIAGYEPYCPYTVNPTPGGSWIAPDLAEARHLVSASGTRGMHVTVLVEPPDATDPTATIGSYVARALERIGYRASLRVATSDTAFFQMLGDSRSRVQIGWFPWVQDYPAPSDFVTPVLTCGAFVARSQSNVNDAEFCDPAIDNAVRRALALEPTAPGAASQAWAGIDRQITDQAPWLPLYNPRLDVATSARVGNYQYHPFFGLMLDQLWVR
jgi:peptide/nickel transport system substrate-binding protein